MVKRWWQKLFGVSVKSPLESKGVAFSYKDSEVLSDVTLKLKKGEILAIIGKSGSGKSTFLKLISGIIGRKYQGSIKIFGAPKVLKKQKIGFVPQEDSFIPDMSLLDNIKVMGLTLGISEKRAIEYARDLLKLLMIDEPLSKMPGELSGGQRVRFNIVLSVLHDPDIYIMDEPFTGLDYKNRRLLWHFISAMQRKGKSIVLTSHLLREVQENATRIVILKDGKVFFRGDLEKLKRKLGIEYVYEVKLTRLTKKAYDEIRKFCIVKDVSILDHYGGYVMFGLSSQNLQKRLQTLFSKVNVGFTEVGFREPNLDEIFMSQ